MKAKIELVLGEKPGLVVREEDSRPRGRGFESCSILDGCKQFASYYIEEKLNIKVSKWSTPKKNNSNKKIELVYSDFESTIQTLFLGV